MKKRHIFTISLTPFIITAIFFSYLYFSNVPFVSYHSFRLEDTQLNDLELNDIKNRLYILGFPNDMLGVLPDSELAKHKDMLYSIPESGEFETDGGKLSITVLFTVLNDHAARCVIFYNWSQNPKNAYRDILLIDFSECITDGFTKLCGDFGGYNFIRRKSDLLNFKYDSEREKDGLSFYLTLPQTKARDGQWGYYAFSFEFISENVPEVGITASYFHQTSWRLFKEEINNFTPLDYKGCTLSEVNFINTRDDYDDESEIPAAIF